MTTYTTVQDFIDAFGLSEMISLTNLDDPAATEINLACLQQNQEKGFARINAIISSCPTVAAAMPFAVAPPILVDLELEVVHLLLDRYLPREHVRKRFEDAIALLKAIGRCEIALGLPGTAPGTPPPGEFARARVTGRRLEFGEDLLARY
jgi:phage gp36-like protein